MLHGNVYIVKRGEGHSWQHRISEMARGGGFDFALPAFPGLMTLVAALAFISLRDYCALGEKRVEIRDS
jgi:hypothetical protein